MKRLVLQHRRLFARAGMVTVIFGVLALLTACTAAPAPDLTADQRAGLALDQDRPTFVYFFTPT
jgi:hypothetical protein